MSWIVCTLNTKNARKVPVRVESIDAIVEKGFYTQLIVHGYPIHIRETHNEVVELIRSHALSVLPLSQDEAEQP